jgi:hypothetical protein
MRLYGKLCALVVASVMVQKLVINDWRHNESVFIARCWMSQMTGDERMHEALVKEAKYFVENDAAFLTPRRTNATLGGR